MEWEIVDGGNPTISRTKLPNGWLVLTQDNAITQIPETWNSDKGTVGWGNVDGYQWRSSICFVPDPKHEWQV